MIVLHVGRNPTTGVWRSMCLLSNQQRCSGLHAYLGLLVDSKWLCAKEFGSLAIPSMVSSTPRVSGTLASLYHYLLHNPVPNWCRTLQQQHPGEELVVHHHGGALAAACLAGGGPGNGIREVMTFHGPPLPTSLATQPVRRFINRYFASLLVHGNVALVSVDRPALNVLDRTLGLNPDLVTVIANGVAPTVAVARERHSCVPFRIGYIGALYHEKGWLIAAEAAQLVHAKGGRVAFVIAGCGPDEAKARKWCEDRPDYTEFLGYVPNTADNVIPTLHCVCLPSLSEGVPNVLLEAMACGTIVVSTSVGGIPNMIENGNDGLLVTRTAAAFAGAIETLIDHPELRERLSLGAVVRIRDTYNIKRVAADYMDLYMQTQSECQYST